MTHQNYAGMQQYEVHHQRRPEKHEWAVLRDKRTPLHSGACLFYCKSHNLSGGPREFKEHIVEDHSY